MNKFVAIVLLALACQMAVAEEFELEDTESQLAVIPSDDEEISYLQGKTQVFSDFCLSSRDYLLNDMKSNTNSLAANVFTLFFKSAEQIGMDALTTNKDATERLANQIRNPDAAVEGDDVVAEGQRRIAEAQVQPKSIYQAVVSALTATGGNLAQNVVSRLQSIKQSLGLAQLVGALQGACDQVGVYENQLRQKFEEARSELAAKDASLAGFAIEDVNCVTTKRIMRIDGLCRFAKVAQNPLMKILGRASH